MDDAAIMEVLRTEEYRRESVLPQKSNCTLSHGIHRKLPRREKTSLPLHALVLTLLLWCWILGDREGDSREKPVVSVIFHNKKAETVMDKCLWLSCARWWWFRWRP